MKDIHRVWLIWWIALLPLCIVIVAGLSLCRVPLDVPLFEWGLACFLALIICMLILWRSPRLRHYNKTFAKHEDDYRYEKEAQ